MINPEFAAPIRFMAYTGIVGTILIGLYVMKFSKVLFGKSKDIPSESSGVRNYTNMQAFVLWLMTLKMFIFLAWAV